MLYTNLNIDILGPNDSHEVVSSLSVLYIFHPKKDLFQEQCTMSIAGSSSRDAGGFELINVSDNSDQSSPDEGGAEITEVLAFEFPPSLTASVGGQNINGSEDEDEDEDNDDISCSASSYSYHTERVDDGDDASDEGDTCEEESQASCQRCAFSNNGANDCFCGGCGMALLPDEQVATKLQADEEALAFQRLQEEELKRKALAAETILVRSQVLIDDVESFVSNYCQQHTENESGVVDVETIPKEPHVILASRFIEHADRAQMEGGLLEFVYHFTKNTPSRLKQIRQTGLGPYASVSTNVEAAFQNPERYAYAPPPTASEKEAGAQCSDDEKSHKDDLVGWIAVVVVDPKDTRCYSNLQQERMVKIGGINFKAKIQAIIHSGECLPLACFGASLRHSDRLLPVLLKGT